ncbi:MAG TPA: hypothetical protein PLS49_02490 [Candidatus Woesebacteria bacterium]|nr:hypothetical protein [Candidatus Woesebacteria bacterium]
MERDIQTQIGSIQSKINRHVESMNSAISRLKNDSVYSQIAEVSRKRFPNSGPEGTVSIIDREARKNFYATGIERTEYAIDKITKDKSEVASLVENMGLNTFAEDLEIGIVVPEDLNILINTLPKRYQPNEQEFSTIESKEERIIRASRGILNLIEAGKLDPNTIQSPQLRQLLDNQKVSLIDEQVLQTEIETVITEAEKAQKTDVIVDKSITRTQPSAETESITPVVIKVNPYTLACEVNGTNIGLFTEELGIVRAIHFYRTSDNTINYSQVEKIFTQLGGNLPEVPEDLKGRERSQFLIESLLTQLNGRIKNKIHQEVAAETALIEWQKRRDTKHPSFPPEVTLALQYIINANPNQRAISFDEIKPILGFTSDKNGDSQNIEWTLPQFKKQVTTRISLITSTRTQEQNRRTALENRFYKALIEKYQETISTHFSEEELQDFIKTQLNTIILKEIPVTESESVTIEASQPEQKTQPESVEQSMIEESTTNVIATGIIINGEVVQLTPRFRIFFEILAANPGITGKELSAELKKQGIETYPADIVSDLKRSYPWMKGINLIITEGGGKATTRRINPEIQFGFAYSQAIVGPESVPVEIPQDQAYEQHTIAAILSIVDPSGMFNTVFEPAYRPQNKELSLYLEQAESCIRDDQHLEMLLDLTDPKIFNERSKRLFRLICNNYRLKHNIEASPVQLEQEIIIEPVVEVTQEIENSLPAIEKTQLIAAEEVTEDLEPQQPELEPFSITFQSRVSEIEEVIRQVAIEMGRGVERISIPHAIQISKKSGIRGLNASDLQKIQFDFGLELPSLSPGNYHPCMNGRQLASIMAYHEIVRNKKKGGATKELNNLLKAEF